MQCYVPMAVIFPPMCKVTDGFSQHGLSVLFYKKTQKNRTDLLTFPKYIICTGVLMTSLDFSSPLI